MSVTLLYKAIPEQTSLFHRLRSDRKISILFTKLFRYGGGPLHVDDLEPEERQDILDRIAENEAFRSRAELDATLMELQHELDKVKAAHPGVENRTALLERSASIIEEGLTEILKRQVQSNTVDLVQRLLYGDGPLAPDFFAPHEEQIIVVSSSAVQARSEMLSTVNPEELIKGEDNAARQYRDDFERWRAFYAEAAAHGEAVLFFVGF